MLETKKDHLKLVIVGHVDHGKSTLIGRLLFDTNSLPEGKIEEIKMVCESLGKELEFGYIMDNFEEERRQNITIDTSQIFFRTKKRDYVIIDAPGHVEFLKNMITGASQAEAAILIVDAKEGIQEQTRRHAYILGMLALKQIIVVINKMDLIDYNEKEYNKIKEELLNFLKEIKIFPKYTIPISAKHGENIAKKSEKIKWYNGPIVLEALDIFVPSKSNTNKPMRFSVQDIYKWGKRIVVGRVETGILRKGDKIIILPSKERTEIETIEEFLKENVQEAIAGKSIGIITKDKVFIDRGNILCKEDEKLPFVEKEFEAQIFWMDNDPLKKGERLSLKCSSQETICEIKEFKKIISSSTLEEIKRDNEIQTREVADVVIKTENPVIIENFSEFEELGRFVLERLNNCAGGMITNLK